MDSLSTKPYKGTRDFYPEQMVLHRYMFEKLRQVAQNFGYSEYNGPLLESFDLYAAKTGEEIVKNQLYWFLDRKKRKVAIRPEMTPTMARMVAQKLHTLPLPIRWFSFPNLWRYERPQRGRLREHWQFNIDLLGGDFLLADIEILQMAHASLNAFGGKDHFTIHINHKNLTDFFFSKKLKLTNSQIPSITRFLDRKKKLTEEEYQEGLEVFNLSKTQIDDLESFFSLSFEKLKTYKCPGAEQLQRIIKTLENLEISYAFQLDTSVFRGMDYYTGLVFEAFDHSKDNLRALFGGGRYDHLIELFSSRKLSGIGFGLGDVTLQNFLESHRLLPSLDQGVDVWMACIDLKNYNLIQKIAYQLRKEGLKVALSLKENSIFEELKKAHKNKAHFTLILGEREFSQKEVALKEMYSKKQTIYKLSDLKTLITNIKSLKGRGKS